MRNEKITYAEYRNTGLLAEWRRLTLSGKLLMLGMATLIILILTGLLYAAWGLQHSMMGL